MRARERSGPASWSRWGARAVVGMVVRAAPNLEAKVADSRHMGDDAWASVLTPKRAQVSSSGIPVTFNE